MTENTNKEEVVNANSEYVIPVSQKTFQRFETFKTIISELNNMSGDSSAVKIDNDIIIDAMIQAMLEEHAVKESE